MTEDLKKDGNGELKPPTKEPKDIVLIITLSALSGFNVQGPGNGKMFDEPMCLYLLEKAKDKIKASNAVASQPMIQKSGGMMNFAKRGFRR